MKKLMITAVLLSGLMSTIFAQVQPSKIHKTPEEKAQAITDRLNEKLNFTAQQKADVYALYLEQARKMDELRKTDPTDGKAQISDRKAAFQDNHAKLQEILTPEQRELYKSIRPQGKEVNRSPEKRAQLMTDMLEKRLNLSAEQKKQVYAIHLQRAAEIETLKSAAQKDRSEMSKKLKTTVRNSDEKIEKVLTADQKDAYKKMKEESKERMKQHRQDNGKDKVRK